jgi:hypothetical protein
MATLAITRSGAGAGQTITNTTSYSGSLGLSISETIAGSATTQINVAVDVSAVTGFMVMSTVATTLKTNSAGSPDDTLVLVANVPYFWHTGAYDTFKFGTDITSLHMVVAGGTSGTLTLEAVIDSTP